MHRLDVSSHALVEAEHSAAGGGGTRGEFPQNLVSDGQENFNKWCVDTHNKSWVKIKRLDFHDEWINGIGFKSANDCPERDPI